MTAKNYRETDIKVFQSFTFFLRVSSSDKMIPLQYFSVSLRFGTCYITGQSGELRIKNAVFGFFLFFFIIKYVFFIIFISFFDEVSNFRGRTSTNQKQELVVQNCQWNCMLINLLCPIIFWD